MADGDSDCKDEHLPESSALVHLKSYIVII